MTTPSAMQPFPPVKRRRVEFVCNLYVPEIHKGVLDFARTARWSVFDWKCYQPSLTVTYEEPMDGTLTIATSSELNEWLKRRTTPIVRLLTCEHAEGSPSVEPDYRAIGVMGAEHLLSLGKPTFAFYRLAENSDTQRMWEGFSSTLASAGCSARLFDFTSKENPQRDKSVERQVRWEWLRDQLATLRPPVAILAEDDRFANDVMEAALMLGWRIPEDLAILGTDNRELIIAKLPVPLSSVDSNLYGVGWAGAAMLQRIMDGETPSTEPLVIPPIEVIRRQSTATFVCAHPGLSASVNFLRSHYHEDIHIEDIARAGSLSTRSLQNLFKDQVGTTLSKELSSLRLQHAARLLRESDLKLESVALEAGLKNAKYLCEVFRTAFGTTPSAYRESKRLKKTS